MIPVLFLLIGLTNSAAVIIKDETVSMTSLEAVEGGVATLPCDLKPPLADDQVSLVIWYKDGSNSPIYSLDVRGRSLSQASHWAEERTLGGRAFFKVTDDHAWLAHLAVESARTEDAGSYRCRIDFRRSPTRNHLVNLTIIVPPESMEVIDEGLNGLERHTIGPYTEGSGARIACIVQGGRPTPSVTWWEGDALLDDSVETLPPGDRVRNVLKLASLERRHLGTPLTCRASNTPLVPVLVKNFTLDMYLRPLEVRLLGENQPLSAGSEYEVACQTSGSRPPARLTWWRSGQRLDNARETTSGDANSTTSTLTLAPQVNDSGKQLSCRANNPHVPNSELETSWILNVHYPPIVAMELGTNLNASAIKEGDDVYFDCAVQANPRISKVLWKHNGKPLSNSRGVIMSNQTLVLQSVARNSSGIYTCVATNSEGEGESDTFRLDVKYGPVCKVGQQRVYGAARHEQVQVNCEVDANPPAGLFRWSFNNSAVHSGDVGAITQEGGRSVASYKPTSERDYGTLLCWGRNELAIQAVPCVFHIVPAGRPDPPRQCELLNKTASSVQVRCLRGFDGGLPQEFTLELYAGGAGPSGGASAGGRLISNVTNRARPEFLVTGLEPSTEYWLLVYSSNGKGRSAGGATLSATTPRGAHQDHRRTTPGVTKINSVSATAATAAFAQVPPYLWVVAGAVATLGAAGLVGVVVLKVRGSGHSDCCWPRDDQESQRADSPDPETIAAATAVAAGIKPPAGAGIAAGGGGASSAAATLLSVQLHQLPGLRGSRGILGAEHLGGVGGPGPIRGVGLASGSIDEGVEMDERNPDVIPHTTDLDNTNLEYMLFEKQQVVAAGLRSSGTSLNIEPTPKMTLYDALPTYSRSVSVGHMRLEPMPVRWHHLMWRDGNGSPAASSAGGDSSSSPVPAVSGPILAYPQATLRQNAETQTPLVRHKESAV